MIVYIVLFIAFAIFILREPKKAMLIWFSVHLLFNECICLKYSSPAISFVLAIDCVLLACFFYKRKQFGDEPFYFKDIFAAYLLSYGVSCLFSTIPFSSIFTNTLKYFIENFGFLYVLQKSINTNDDIRFLLKVCIIVFSVILLLAVVESVFMFNPVLEYVYHNAPLEAISGKIYYSPLDGEIHGLRFGVRRCFSFFGIHIALGTAAAFFSFFCLYMKRKKMLGSFHFALLLISTVSCVLLSGSKTSYVGFFPFLFAILTVRDVVNKKVIFASLSIICFVIYFLPNYLMTFYSLFDAELAEEGGGSDVAMRERQLEVVLEMFYQNPLFGSGVGALKYLFNGFQYEDALGTESSWFKILPERGILGICVYLYLYYSLFQKMIKFCELKLTMFFLLGLLGMETATGFMPMPIWGGIIVVLYKYALINNEFSNESNYNRTI